LWGDKIELPKMVILKILKTLFNCRAHGYSIALNRDISYELYPKPRHIALMFSQRLQTGTNMADKIDVITKRCLQEFK
jgi:hypothetical protein